MITSEWQAPENCPGGSCIEVRLNAHGAVEMRTTHDRAPLTATRAEWDAHVAAVKAGQYDDGPPA